MKSQVALLKGYVSVTDKNTLRTLRENGYRYLILGAVILDDTNDNIDEEGTVYWEVIPSQTLPPNLPEAAECIAIDEKVIESTIGSDCCVFVVSKEYLKLTYGMQIL